METWAPSTEHPGYRCKTIQRGDCTICILRPELEPEERRKREAHTQAVAERVLKDLQKGIKTHEQHHHH